MDPDDNQVEKLGSLTENETDAKRPSLDNSTPQFQDAANFENFDILGKPPSLMSLHPDPKQNNQNDLVIETLSKSDVYVQSESDAQIE